MVSVELLLGHSPTRHGVAHLHRRRGRIAKNFPSRTSAEIRRIISGQETNNGEGIELEDLCVNCLESFTLDDFPSLPLVNTAGIDFGNPKTLELYKEAYVPSRPVSIKSFLAEPLPQAESTKKTLKEKTIRKAHQALALLKNPRADTRFPYLPKGLNSRHNSKKDPLRDKYRRFRHPKPRKPSNTVVERPTSRVPAPELRAVQSVKPAAPRHIPKVKPSKKLKSADNLDRFLNPLGGELEVFYQTPEEREQRVKLVNSENDWRNWSNHLLARKGRNHLADWKIGRAPPLSKRQLIESKLPLPPAIKINTTALIPGLPTGDHIHSVLTTKPRKQPKVVLNEGRKDNSKVAAKVLPERITFDLPVHSRPLSGKPPQLDSPYTAVRRGKSRKLQRIHDPVARKADTQDPVSKSLPVGYSKAPNQPHKSTASPTKDSDPQVETSQDTASENTQLPLQPVTEFAPLETTSAQPFSTPVSPDNSDIESDLAFLLDPPRTFDFATQSNIFVGFARLPESSFLMDDTRRG